jgi:BirA family biotin operon repressor/biotin-[acetyl-CoA-carboxylase] ligase
MPGGSDLLPKEFRPRLETRLFGRRVYYVPVVDSTNRLAADLARAGESHGSLVVTDHQTEGRGRRDRSWESPPGRNLLFSLILRPEGSARDVLPLTLAFSLGTARALSDLLSVKTGVKWPNDVEAEGRKIAGTLAEGATRGDRTKHLIVGIGVNVNERIEEFGGEFRDRACSCFTITGREWDRGAVLAAILLQLERAYDEFDRGGFAPMADRYKASLGILEKRVRFERRGGIEAGTVADVAPDGGLVVDTAAGRVTLYEEEVIRVREDGQ